MSMLFRLWQHITDMIQGIFLVLYLLILRFGSMIRGGLMGFEKVYWHTYILFQVRSLTPALRLRIDWLLGNHMLALTQLRHIIQSVEVYQDKHRKNRHLNAASKRVLLDLYQTHIHYGYKMGSIENVMAVIMRAQKTLKSDELSRRVGICHKTAEIIQVTISASRILEGGNVAALLYKEGLSLHETDTTDNLSHNNHDAPGSEKTPQNSKQACKVIPFPFCRIKSYTHLDNPINKNDRS
ncbi:MAG: hypothetical protein OXC44_08365 [Proteobacteria bacterium]|nr:hypothetical protein [Pseudomonadota bacterium]